MKKIIFLFLCILWISLFLLRDTFFDRYYFSEWEKKYENQVFSGAITQFENISDRAVANHNIGNSYYKLWKEFPQDAQMYFSQAVDAYELSLAEEENNSTRKNYEYVKRLLEENSQQDESQQSQEQELEQETSSEENENQSGSGSEDSEQSGTWGGDSATEQTSTIQDYRGEQYMLSEDKPVESLSPEEQQALDEYVESLKAEQQQNQKYFWKKEDTSGNDPFDSFFSNPFFETQFDRGWEKDW